MKRARGFTLIEILVVLVVLGIIVAALLPKLGDLSDSRDLERDVRRLGALLGLANEEAVMQGREFGLRVSQREYAFYDLDVQTGAWLEVVNDDTLRSRSFPDDVELTLLVEDTQVLLDAELREFEDADEQDSDSEIKTAPPPHVALLSSGETTPFELRVRDRYGDSEFIIAGDAYGVIEFRTEVD